MPNRTLITSRRPLQPTTTLAPLAARPRWQTSALLLAVTAALAACTTSVPAPVVDRTARSTLPPPPAPAVAPPAVRPAEPGVGPGATAGSAFYVVQRGDTLFSIARNNKLDLNAFLAWNGLVPGQAIREGQVLRLTPPGGAIANGPAPATGPQPTAGNPVITPVPGAGVIQGQPLPPASGAAPSLSPLPAAGSAAPVGSVTPVEAPLKREPKAQRLPYSDAAYATLQRGDAPTPATGSSPAATSPASGNLPPSSGNAPATPASGSGATAAATSAPLQDADVKPGNGVERDGIVWTWPTTGKVVSKFSDKAPMKGIDIAANTGTPVVAAAAGKVIYVGKEPRGYGQMIVISHAKETVSVYFHTDKVLVKEQQRVLIGQKLAEVADGASNRMHFEVRRQGRPLDPVALMPR